MDGEREREEPTGSRVRLVLLLLLVFGLPLLVMAALVTVRVPEQATSGSQPGGIVTGEVRDPDARGIAGVELRFGLVSAGGEWKDGPRGTTDSAGRFAIALPPCEGSYELRAGGGTWQRASRAISFLGQDGQPLQPRSLVVVLEPGSDLEIRFHRADGTALGDGTFDLEGDLPGGWLFGLVKPRAKLSGPVRAGVLHAEALPPTGVEVRVRFDDGERVSLSLVLAPGANRQRVEL